MSYDSPPGIVLTKESNITCDARKLTNVDKAMDKYVPLQCSIADCICAFHTISSWYIFFHSEHHQPSLLPKNRESLYQGVHIDNEPTQQKGMVDNHPHGNSLYNNEELQVGHNSIVYHIFYHSKVWGLNKIIQLMIMVIGHRDML